MRNVRSSQNSTKMNNSNISDLTGVRNVYNLKPGAGVCHDIEHVIGGDVVDVEGGEVEAAGEAVDAEDVSSGGGEEGGPMSRFGDASVGVEVDQEAVEAGVAEDREGEDVSGGGGGYVKPAARGELVQHGAR